MINKVAQLINKFQAFVAPVLNISGVKKEYLKTFFVLITVHLFILILGFLTRVKLANLLGKDGFGLLAYGIALGAFGGALVRYGLDRTMVRDLIHKPREFSSLVIGSIVWRVTVLIIIILCIVVWKYYGGDKDLTWPIMAIIFATCLLSLEIQAVYDAWNKMQRHAVFNLLQKAIYFLIIWSIIIIWPTKLSMESISLAMMGASLFFIIFQYQWALKRIDLVLTPRAMVNDALYIGKKNSLVFIASIAGLAFGTINQVILKQYCGTAVLGGYAAGWQFVILSMAVLNQVARIGKPVIARNTQIIIPRKQKINSLSAYFLVMLCASSAIGVPVIFFPDVIITAIFDQSYISAVPAFRLMGIYILIFSCGLVSSQYIISVGMERLYTVCIFIGGLLSSLLCFLMIPAFDGIGAISALIIGHGFSIMLYFGGIFFDLNRKTCVGIETAKPAEG